MASNNIQSYGGPPPNPFPSCSAPIRQQIPDIA